MRIVDLPTFLSLPSGTLYHEYEPCVSGPLCVKYETYEGVNEWVLLTVDGFPEETDKDGLFDRLHRMEEAGESYPYDHEATVRNGVFPNDGLYLVYERSDLERLYTLIGGLLE